MHRPLLAGCATALLDERRQLTADELAALADLGDEAVPALAALAHEVRLAWSGATVEVEGMLSNALIVGNYLTTLGRRPEEDLQMLADLKMPIGSLSAAV